MAAEERFDRLEHYTAGLNDMFQRQREEDRALWRETKRELDEMGRELREEIRILAQQAAERDRITDERFRQTAEQIAQLGARIDSLVSGIGEFIRQSRK